MQEHLSLFNLPETIDNFRFYWDSEHNLWIEIIITDNKALDVIGQILKRSYKNLTNLFS